MRADPMPKHVRKTKSHGEKTILNWTTFLFFEIVTFTL